METDRPKDSKPEMVAKSRRYIRFQQAAWLMLCAWPVALIAMAYYYRVPTMAEGDIALAVGGSVVWIAAAVIMFYIGYSGQKELKKQETKSTE